MSKIAVILTVHNRVVETQRCLECINNATETLKHTIGVFLVDDASTDGTKEFLAREFPQVIQIAGSGQLYWNGGMHLAWQEAAKQGDYDYYLWLNNDTYLLEDSIEVLLEASAKKQDQAILCGMTVSEETSERTYGGWNFDDKPITHENGWGLCDIINGNCVLVPRFVFEKVGFLDPIFPHSLGDHDYGLRAKKLGIDSYSSEFAIGYCESNPRPPRWCQPKVPLKERVSSLYSPLANSTPIPYFIYIRRHFGIIRAMQNFISIHLRVVFPKLWTRR